MGSVDMGYVAVIGRAGIHLVLGVLLPHCGIISTEILSFASDDNCILVLGENADITADRNSVFAAVVNSDAGFPAEKLKGIPVITCGMGGHNTVSVTSRTAEKITVSLNRTISSMSGVCEPQELPMPLVSGAEEYDYMAAFAAALLLGRI